MFSLILFVYCIHEVWKNWGDAVTVYTSGLPFHRQIPTMGFFKTKAIGNVQNLLAGRSATWPQFREGRKHVSCWKLLFGFDMFCCCFLSYSFVVKFMVGVHFGTDGWDFNDHNLFLQSEIAQLAQRDWSVRMIFGNEMILLTWECLKKFFVESNPIVDFSVCAPLPAV